MQIFRRTILAALLCAATVAPAQDRVRNAGVQERMELMQQAKHAMDTLVGMMGNRILFDRQSARTARRILIRATSDIQGAFRRRHADPLSNARQSIWINWTDFKSRAELANDAARDLNARSLPGLRRTVPTLMQACLACHESYRHPRKMVKTH